MSIISAMLQMALDEWQPLITHPPESKSDSNSLHHNVGPSDLRCFHFGLGIKEKHMSTEHPSCA